MAGAKNNLQKTSEEALILKLNFWKRRFDADRKIDIEKKTIEHIDHGQEDLSEQDPRIMNK